MGVGLEELLPEAKLQILRCICADADALPAGSLRAMARASREWRGLSLSPETLPFLASLRCRLLVPADGCRRAGDIWPPPAPLEAHRFRDSQPPGERDELVRCLHVCLKRRFRPAEDLCERLNQAAELEEWLRLLRGFREEHLGHLSGPEAPATPGAASAAPQPVWCAAACVLPDGRVCVVGGGCYCPELARAQTDWVEVLWHQPAAHIFDAKTRTWEPRPVAGAAPPAAHTYAAAHTLLGDRWVFWCGGYYGQAYNTAYALDVTSWEWRELRNSSSRSPSPRYFAASFEHQKALFAWGGRGAENAYCADLWRLDPSRAQQDVVHCEEVPTSGSPPPAKFAATLTNCDDRFALLYGGGRWVLGGRFQPDVETYTLDLATHAWARLALSGPQPRPRCQHAAVNLGGNLVLVLGGYDGNRREYLGLEDVCVLNVRSLKWMNVHGQPPLPPRPAHSSSPRSAMDEEDEELEEAEEAEEDEEDEEAEEAGEQQGGRRGGIFAPICEDASAKSAWIQGDFPCHRAGIALADASSSRGSAGRGTFYVFGGAQYVHQDWYSDLYECTLRGQLPEPAGEAAPDAEAAGG